MQLPGNALRGTVLALCASAALAGCASGASMRGTHSAMMAAGGSLDGWSAASREAIADMTAKYGRPNEMTPTMAVWHNNGPWKRTIVYRTEVPHSFPMQHPDVMQQFVDYRVPTDRYDELAMYDGSVVVERTNGEISARCDKEGANFLALNLAQEIATGRRTAEDARRMYAEQIMAMKAGRPAPYTERLLFTPMRGTSMDPDRPASR
jgi:hypothetical protein